MSLNFTLISAFSLTPLEAKNSLFDAIFVFSNVTGPRLRVSVLEAFDPLLLNDSSETADQGKFN